MKLIVGLGNPGKQYERTRHNVGFLIADAIISYFLFPISKLDKKINALISKGVINDKRMLVAKPTTFMNNSGQAVSALLNFYKLTPAALVIIHDDKDVPLGEFKIQTNRGAAGHNGVQSIIDQLGTKNFTRIRVGIGLPLPAGEVGVRGRVNTAEFVLGKFTKEEQRLLSKVIIRVVEELKNLVAIK